jgi:fucose 4-O-acetylase-like acetyltransferase
MNTNITFKEKLSEDITFREKLSQNLYFIRGMAIFLVVIGHVIGNEPKAGILQLYGSDILLISTFCKFIYTFHVWLFFIVSGVGFAVFSNANSNWKNFTSSRFKRLLIPLICWSPATFILRAYQNGTQYSLFDVLKSIIQPSFIFWFFHALIFASFLSFLCLNIFKSKTFYLFISAALSLVFLVIIITTKSPNAEYLYANYLQGNMFYALGVFLAAFLERISLLINSLPSPVTVLSLIMCAVLMVVNFSFLPSQFNYIGMLINGILAFLFLYIAFNKKIEILPHLIINKLVLWLHKNLEYWGNKSMVIYLFHVYFGAATRIAIVKLFHSTSPILHLTLGSLIAIIGPLILYNILVNKSKFFAYSIGEA